MHTHISNLAHARTSARFPMRAVFAATIAVVAGTLVACKSSATADAPKTQPAPTGAKSEDPMAAVHTVARDRDVWQQLLADHQKIYRRVVHRQDGDLGIVEATTESDDPQVAARIIDHALAMQTRMKAGAPVRIWDPVFRDLFDHHAKVSLVITTTARGVTITESSRDPETISLLRSHAMGVSEFIRRGPEAAPDHTPRLPAGAPLPAPEVAIGGVAHRFLLSQPDAAQLAALKLQGVSKVVNFRTPGEPGVYDESAAAQSSSVEYCNIPYRAPAQLTDAVLEQARAEYRAAQASGTALALHCRTGNRVGPGWAYYLALDKGVSPDAAIAGAHAVGMVDPLYESITRDAIRRALAQRSGASAAWTPCEPEALSPPQRAQKQRAEEARALLYTRLSAALTEAMTKPDADGQPAGPAGAITVCKDQAPRIAQAVSRERGVMIGRTSDKLRNPGNTSPAWAAPLLAAKPSQPVFVANPDGSLGAALPIALSSNCLACHGAPDKLNPNVRAALTALYPDDHATGYQEGDLRGWFWIEVPPPVTQPVSSPAG